jgi:hypothetical protein
MASWRCSVPRLPMRIIRCGRVHAALGMQRALGIYRDQLVAERGIQFQVRMGLNTGAVVVGKIGDNLRMDYTAVGDTTNLAARLEKPPLSVSQRLQTGRPEALARGTPSHHPEPILRACPDRSAAPRLAACRFRWPPPRAGEPLARRARSGRRRRARECLRGIVRGCAPEGPAIKCF